ncbi:hypothetical protein V2S66_27915 [Streptomyces sp. V4-01]|uniref:Lipoprotein n=1 Tax=Actinacidiphila polyblastidii TaxID=3110430 RepID=A0ABU7PIY7_9ACTN|nr:hypothetical protein [Streptomyces sp. V4-01]
MTRGVRAGRTGGRVVAAGVAVCGLLGLTTGCTVPVGAVTGITVTPDGSPVGVIRTCGHAIDGATLYVSADDPAKETENGKWTSRVPLSGLTTWPLAAAGPGWTTRRPLTPLAEHTVYTLYGWTSDNSSSAAAVDFTPADLRALSPAQVRYDAPGLPDADADGQVTVALSAFRAHACEH